MPPKSWLGRIPAVWQVKLLRYPVCQNPRRVVAVINDLRVPEKILRYPGGWRNPPPRPPPRGVRGTYTDEPCGEVDPMPDYENGLTE